MMVCKNSLAAAVLLGLFSVAVLGSIPFIAPLGTAASAAAITQVASAEIQNMLAKKDFVLINVHIPYEGEIEKTDTFIAFDKIPENLGKLPKEKNARIVVYCRSGRMSALAAQELLAQGYTQVFDLVGGMNDWTRSGYKIIRK